MSTLKTDKLTLQAAEQAGIALPSEPLSYDEHSLDAVLSHVSRKGVSDIHFTSEEQVFVQFAGRVIPLTSRRIRHNEIEALVNHFYGANGVAQLNKGMDFDTSYSVLDAGDRFRYRVNATSGTNQGRKAFQLTLRTISSTPRALKDLNLEPAIVENFLVESGLVLVCGKTGSGKTTMLSSMIRDILERPDSNKNLLTYEAPIEFVYDSVVRTSALIFQSQVPDHLLTFAAGVRNALRRAPSIILIGESRDYETMSAALEAAETGHMVMSTVHADSVHGALYRMVNMFPPSERSTKLFEIVEALRMVVVQKLEIRVGGGRIALREFLVFDQSVRDRLRHCESVIHAVAAVARLVEERGQSMLVATRAAVDAGALSQDHLASLEAISRGKLLLDDFESLGA